MLPKKIATKRKGLAILLLFILSFTFGFFIFFKSFKPILAVTAIDKIRNQKSARLSYAMQNKTIRLLQLIFLDPSQLGVDISSSNPLTNQIKELKNNSTLVERHLAFYGLKIVDTPNGKLLSYRGELDSSSPNAILLKDIFDSNGENVLLNPDENNSHYNLSIYQAIHRAFPMDLINVLSPNSRRVHQRIGASRNFFSSGVTDLKKELNVDSNLGYTDDKLLEHNYKKLYNNLKYSVANENSFGFPFWSQTVNDYITALNSNNNVEKKQVFCHMRDIVLYLNQVIELQRIQTLANSAVKAYVIADSLRIGDYNNDELQTMLMNSSVNKAKNIINQLPEDISNQIINDYKLDNGVVSDSFEEKAISTYSSNGSFAADDFAKALTIMDKYADTNLESFETGDCNDFKTFGERNSETLPDTVLGSINNLVSNQADLNEILNKTVTFFLAKEDLTDANSIPLDHLLTKDYYSLVYAGSEALNNEYSRSLGSVSLSDAELDTLDKQARRHYFATAQNPNPNFIKRLSSTFSNILGKKVTAATEAIVNIGGSPTKDNYGIKEYFGFTPKEILGLGTYQDSSLMRGSFEECYLTHDSYIYLKGRQENTPTIPCGPLLKNKAKTLQTEYREYGNWFLSCQMAYELTNWVDTSNSNWRVDPCKSYVNDPVCQPIEQQSDPLWQKQNDFYDNKSC